MNRLIIAWLAKQISTCRKKRGSPGFTIIELMVVITVIGIMLAIGVPAIMAITNRAGAQYAADELYGILMEAKIRAVRSNTNCTVTFNPAPANSYNRLCLDEAARGEAGETVILAKYRGNVTFANSPNAGDAAPTGAITFTPQGFAPNQSGPVYIQEIDNNIFYRVRTGAAGGTTVDRYSETINQWR